MLHHPKDRRAVGYFIFASALLALNWNLDLAFGAIGLSGGIAVGLKWFLVFIQCFTAITITTIAHNHNHNKIWKNKALNIFTDYWITCFYGFPTFAWIPTHNRNHHKFNNKEGDYTITYRYSEANNLLTLLSYPSVSSWFQQTPIKDYLKMMWKRRKPRFWYFISQYVVVIAFFGLAFLIDWRKALLYVVLPTQVGMFAVLVFNYLQHVHCDEESKFNHSRNIVGPVMNMFLFNNGYHTVHHDNPALHWSDGPAAHAKIADKIHPSLNEHSILWLLFRVYFLGIFLKKFRTQSMRVARMAEHEHEAQDNQLAAAE